MTVQVCEKKDIEELIEKIETAASFINTVNPDNIFILYPEDFDDVSEFAEDKIREYSIHIYDSPYADYVYDELEKLISAKNQKEFIYALEQYARALEQWAKLEEESTLLILDYFEPTYTLNISELKEQEEIYSNWSDVWDYSIYRGRAYIKIYKERRKLFTEELELYTAELYHPTYGFCTLKIDTEDIDDVIEDLNGVFEKYENSQLTSYELYEKITEVL